MWRAQNPQIIHYDLRHSPLKVTLEGTSFPSSFASPELVDAAHSQQTIGMYNMTICIFSTEWATALGAMGMDYPTNMMAQILSMTWDPICEVLRKTRNQI